ncbi:MAG: hypothetical protein PUC40_01245 [Lachnospiraceae bacterium]|nr:hypothetical protein [Lachnospiraceae bacterium]MDY3990474.1 hypothetical protein [Lachnospiraceae bacterium]
MDGDHASCRSLDRPYAGSDRSSFQYYIIDGFIVSDNIDVQSLRTLPLNFRNSDHNPLVLTVKLK